MLSGSAPPATAAACTAALDVVEHEPEHNRRLWENTNYFKKALKQMGYDTGNSTTPITPAMCGESAKAQALSVGLYEDGIFAFPIVFPMVARDKSRIRTMMNAGLTRADCDKALAAFEKHGKKLKII